MYNPFAFAMLAVETQKTIGIQFVRIAWGASEAQADIHAIAFEKAVEAAGTLMTNYSLKVVSSRSCTNMPQKQNVSRISIQEPKLFIEKTSSILSGQADQKEYFMSKDHPKNRRSNTRDWLVPTLLGSALALGASALYARSKTREAERLNPPIGSFITVDGVRLHYIDRGQGQPLVLIHGNGTMIQDFLVSGIVDELAERYRVIIIDRPGYGYSDRPRGLWTPRAHATLFQKALQQLGVSQAVVLGHSWGTLVAIALALQAPQLVRSLVLASGYFYPTLRADAILSSPPAIPVIGDVLRYTVSPVVGRLLLPGMIKGMFAPAAVPERFDREFPKDMMLRPLQLRASAEDAAMMSPVTMELQKHYQDLKLPIVLVTGADDQIADIGRQSERLHNALPDSELIVVPGMGHMIHHLAPGPVIKAIDRASERARTRVVAEAA